MRHYLSPEEKKLREFYPIRPGYFVWYSHKSICQHWFRVEWGMQRVQLTRGQCHWGKQVRNIKAHTCVIHSDPYYESLDCAEFLGLSWYLACTSGKYQNNSTIFIQLIKYKYVRFGLISYLCQVRCFFLGMVTPLACHPYTVGQHMSCWHQTRHPQSNLHQWIYRQLPPHQINL